MKSVLCCFPLFAAGLLAQSTAKLDADLRALANPGASQSAITQLVADDILALADKNARPSRQTVVDFADALTKAFYRTVDQPRRRIIVSPLGDQPTLQTVTQAILDVLQSSGKNSYDFHSAIDRFHGSMIVLNPTAKLAAAQAKSAADRLWILGQEVRGPDDMKVGVR